MWESLRKKKEIERLYKAGRTKKGRMFLLKFVPDLENKTKVLIVVGKKISKLAVTRNRVKRKIRAGLRTTNIRAGFDYSIMPFADLSKTKQTEIEEELQKIF